MKVIKAGTYNIYTGENIFPEMNKLLRSTEFRNSRIFVLVDENSLKYCYPILFKEAVRIKDAEIIEIESGERNKDIEVCKNIWLTLSQLKADRRSVLINLGGGVIGDMGGFVASTFKRGISFINVPTTLLSQVDASVGGKLGIDLGGLKNEVGVFGNPAAVFVNPFFLHSLPSREYFSGYAEIIKHALIADKHYWKEIVSQKPLPPFSRELERLIVHSIGLKNKIVKLDPKETGLRKVLNFGHTIGHALESLSLEGDEFFLLHGEAVIAGMICEAYLSYKKAGLPKAELAQITSFLLAAYKPVNFDKFDELRLVELMKHDKKNLGSSGAINFTLLERIGKAQFDKKCSIELIKESLRYYREEAKLKS